MSIPNLMMSKAAPKPGNQWLVSVTVCRGISTGLKAVPAAHTDLEMLL